jgi:hypothetical protein
MADNDVRGRKVPPTEVGPARPLKVGGELRRGHLVKVALIDLLVIHWLGGVRGADALDGGGRGGQVVERGGAPVRVEEEGRNRLGIPGKQPPLGVEALQEIGADGPALTTSDDR